MTWSATSAWVQAIPDRIGGVPICLAQLASRTYYEVSRLRSLDQWWHWLLLLLVGLLVICWVISVYRRDTVELPRPTRWSLQLLRLLAFGGLLLFFLQIEKRTEKQLVKPSRAILLVDTSQSMGLADSDSGDTTAVAQATMTRAEKVSQLLQGPLLTSLRAAHDVLIYRFDEGDRPEEVAAFPRQPRMDEAADAQELERLRSLDASRAQWLLGIGSLAGAAAAMALLAHWALGRSVRTQEGESWAILMAIVAGMVAVVFFAVSHLRYPHLGWPAAWATAPPAEGTTQPADTAAAAAGGGTAASEPSPDWLRNLAPRGNETRLGSALQYLVEQQRGGPLAGLAVFTDGNSNAGVDCRAAIGAAQQAEIPVHVVGLGSERRPANARIVDVVAPQRVYPGDRFKISSYLQAYGMSGQAARLQLLVDPQATGTPSPSVPDEGQLTLVEERAVTLLDDGHVAAVEFEVEPDQAGWRHYVVRLLPGPDDEEPSDDQSTVKVQIVTRQNHVLLLAGGPTREYHFLRDMLYRDQESKVDVLLQSSPPNAVQDSHRILTDFPSVPEELFDYDCLVAFDPNWALLEDHQIELLERWVAEKAGGLILVAGAVHTPEWSTLRRDAKGIRILKGLYPVTFYSRGVIRLSRSGQAEAAQPLEFTDDGRRSEFLWLDDTESGSEQIWAAFEGVYAPLPVKGVKPGATLLATVRDESRGDQPAPVVLAEQFYGAGRVLYLGSGEFWRLRAQSPSHFERFYTKTVRHVSQGRLLRDSSRGLLLVSKDRCLLGESIVVRAALTDAQYRPLEQDSVRAELLDPDGLRQPLLLRRLDEAGRPGTFAGQFTATRAGDYRVELIIPEGDLPELLSREVRARVPRLEVENPQRNDPLLAEITQATGGTFFSAWQELYARDGEPLAERFVPQDQETFLPGTPDRSFQQRLMGWLMAFICGVLSLEWLIRRLHKLA